jgi:hypothetical protein
MLGSATRAGHRLRCREPAIVARLRPRTRIFHAATVAVVASRLIAVHLIWRKTIAFFKQPGAILAPNGHLARNLARPAASIPLLVSTTPHPVHRVLFGPDFH